MESTASLIRACHSNRSICLLLQLRNGIQALDQTTYWLELLEESRITDNYVIEALRNEADALSVILISNLQKLKPQRRNLKDDAVKRVI